MERDDEDTADHTVYLLPNDLLSSTNNTGSRETIATKGLPEEIPKSIREGIAKISEIKYQCGDIIQIASNIRYLVLDIRVFKKTSKKAIHHKDIEALLQRNASQKS